MTRCTKYRHCVLSCATCQRRATTVKRLIAILASPGVQMLDVAGPLDVFSEANRLAPNGHEYELVVVGYSSRSIVCSSGARLTPDLTLRDPLPRLDTLLVAGSPDIARAPRHLVALKWLQQTSRKSKRFGAVCNGAWLLAEAGLIDGRRITTHWDLAHQICATFPEVQVDADAFYLRDGPVCTSAGVTAGMDLALALVEEDLGREIAKQVASQLVLYFKRPGGQLQFSRKGEAEFGGRLALQELQRWVNGHLEVEHSVSSMAERVGLSPRHFARVFQQEVGMTPAEFVEISRVNAARRMLESQHAPPKKVAALCGFANVNGLRRAFVRQVGITPAAYRRQYGA